MPPPTRPHLSILLKLFYQLGTSIQTSEPTGVSSIQTTTMVEVELEQNCRALESKKSAWCEGEGNLVPGAWCSGFSLAVDSSCASLSPSCHPGSLAYRHLPILFRVQWLSFGQCAHDTIRHGISTVNKKDENLRSPLPSSVGTFKQVQRDFPMFPFAGENSISISGIWGIAVTPCFIFISHSRLRGRSLFASLESRQHSLDLTETSEDRCLVIFENKIVVIFFSSQIIVLSVPHQAFPPINLQV